MRTFHTCLAAIAVALIAASSVAAPQTKTIKVATWNMAWLTDRMPGTGGDAGVPAGIHHRTKAIGTGPAIRQEIERRCRCVRGSRRALPWRSRPMARASTTVIRSTSPAATSLASRSARASSSRAIPILPSSTSSRDEPRRAYAAARISPCRSPAGTSACLRYISSRVARKARWHRRRRSLAAA